MRVKMLYIITVLVVLIQYTLPVQSITYTSVSNTIYVTDAMGRTIVLNKQPTRIVSLAPSITELIFYIGIQDRLVGVDNTSYTDPYYNISTYVKQHGVKPVGGYWWSTIDVEKILALQPDLVLADKGAHQQLLQLFEDYNITVVYLNAGASRSIQDIYADIDILSRVFNKTGIESIFINKLEREIEEYREKLASLHGRRILVVVGIYNGIWVAGKSTFIDDILSRLGLVNPVDVVGWKTVSIEKIAGWNPDIILVASMGISEETIRESGLYDLGKPVIILDKETTDSLLRPGPLILKAPSLLYSVLRQFISNETTTTTTHQSQTTTTITTTTTTTTTAGYTSSTTTRNTGYTSRGGGNTEASTIIAVAAVMAIVGFIAGYVISRYLGKTR